MKFDEQKVAMITGLLVGGMHLVWALIVASGLAQLLLDFIYGLHFLNNPFTVNPFDLTNAIILVIFTTVVGYIVGWAGTWLWNKVYKK